LINVRESEGAVKIGPSRKTINIGYTRHRTKTNNTNKKNIEKNEFLLGIKRVSRYQWSNQNPYIDEEQTRATKCTK